jgi:hypothetical protein
VTFSTAVWNLFALNQKRVKFFANYAKKTAGFDLGNPTGGVCKLFIKIELQ